MIIYIHGFASSGMGQKALMVRNFFGKRALAPSLSYVPDLAVDTLKQIIECFLPEEPVSLIGSSLGGFYAAHLSEIYDLKAVLINPSVEPYKTLSRYTGVVTNFHDLSGFEWNDRHIEQLERMKPGAGLKPENLLLLLQTGDETLDYRTALRRIEIARELNAANKKTSAKIEREAAAEAARKGDYANKGTPHREPCRYR